MTASDLTVHELEVEVRHPHGQPLEVPAEFARRVLVKVSIALQQKVDMLGVQSRGGQGKQLNLTRLACPRLMVMNA